MPWSKYKNLVFALAAVALAATVVMSNIQFEPAAASGQTGSACTAEGCSDCPNAATCPSASATGQLTVDRARCNGCTRCTVVAPRTFAMDKSDKATVINPHGDSDAAINNAVQGCRKHAIVRH